MLIKVEARPDSKQEFVEKLEEDKFKIWVREPAERGEANKKIIKILNNIFPKKRVILVLGGKSFNKVFKIF